MRFLGILLLAASAWAQTDGITTAVSRTVVLQADEARFTLQASVPTTTTLEQVIQAMPGLGLQASDLVAQSTGSANTFPYIGLGLTAVFNFAFTRPADSYNAISAKLETLRVSPPTGFTIQYGSSLAASNNAIEATRRNVLPGLLADARAKGLTMANAANLTLGAIRSISDIGDTSTVGLIGDFTSSSNFRTTYSLTVRFGVQ